ncbi:hypothetical protein D3P96_00465 [Weissella viridescens]|uniref:Uncharacterized protein n=1 Tax=Weissella viridescens TaxID=1629 RepID=A0A3P2RFV6_WEIVI|nr:hypothetical protein [Weissella viridescens]RRG18496.1 hypothetical protein D3P96_00465 [Weissella viridescens]
MSSAEDQIIEIITDIWQVTDETIGDADFWDLYFLGKNHEGNLDADFWFLDRNQELVFFSEFVESGVESSEEHQTHLNAYRELVKELVSVLKGDRDDSVAQDILITFGNNDGDISLDTTINYVDLLAGGFDETDILNYYLIETVGDDFVQENCETKAERIEHVRKMQEYKETHSN